MIHVSLLLIQCCVVWGQTTPDDRAKKLAEKLRIGKTQQNDVMTDVITRMGEVTNRLSREFDAGEETQALQLQIIADLDRAIEASIRRNEPGKGRSKPSLDKRRKSGRNRPKKNGKKTGDGKAAARAKKGTVKHADESKEGSSIRDRLRSWGQLPDRDRDEVIQGAREQSVPRFRKWIERYYRALAEEEVE